MKKLSIEQMETTEGGRFWGTDYDILGDSGCMWIDTYVFWIRTSHQLYCATD